MITSGNGIRVSATFAVVALLAACAAKKPSVPVDSRSGNVAVRTIASPPTETYTAPEKGEDYDSPSPFDENVPPQYPARLLVQLLPPVIVKVRLIVDEGGSVTQVSPLDPAANSDPAFFASVETAVRTWQFSPLVRFGKGDGSTTIEFHGKKMIYQGRAQALPFHQDYEFTFTQRDGKGFVSTSAHE